ncbi:hypothetical protein ABK040_003286 [Willaertia magna]
MFLLTHGTTATTGSNDNNSMNNKLNSGNVRSNSTSSTSPLINPFTASGGSNQIVGNNTTIGMNYNKHPLTQSSSTTNAVKSSDYNNCGGNSSPIKKMKFTVFNSNSTNCCSTLSNPTTTRTLNDYVKVLPYPIILLILEFIELPLLLQIHQYPHHWNVTNVFENPEQVLQLRKQLVKLLFGYFKSDGSRTIHFIYKCIDFETKNNCGGIVDDNSYNTNSSSSTGEDSYYHQYHFNEMNKRRMLTSTEENNNNTNDNNNMVVDSSVVQYLSNNNDVYNNNSSTIRNGSNDNSTESNGNNNSNQFLVLTNHLQSLLFRTCKFISLRFSDCNISDKDMKCFGLNQQGKETIVKSKLRTLDFSKNHNFHTEGFIQYFPSIEKLNGNIPYPNLTYLNLLETATDANVLLHACNCFVNLVTLKHSYWTEQFIDYNICVETLAKHPNLQILHLECTSGYYALNMIELLKSKSLRKIALFGFLFTNQNVNSTSFEQNQSLKKLSLTNCHISNNNREHVIESISSATSLRELILSEINLENQDIVNISERMDKLSTLIIGGSDEFHMNTSGFVAFHMLRGLKKFVIDGFSDYCSLNLDTCRAFCLSTLTFLELDGFCKADDTYLTLMLKQGVNLKALKVKQTKISCSDNVHLAKALKNHQKLLHLKLDENEAIGDSGALLINNNLPPSLTKLGLTMCNISDIGAKALLSNTQLRKLKIKMNNITDESLKLLRYNNTLSYISLDALRSEEIVRIIGEENKSLRKLSVISIPLTENTVTSLTKNHTLHYLKIKNCDCVNERLKQLLIDTACFGVIFKGIFDSEAYL